MAKRELRIVRLLEPELCLECPFGHIAQVQAADGRYEPAIRCRRLDCDNWDFSAIEPADAYRLTELDR